MVSSRKNAKIQSLQKSSIHQNENIHQQVRSVLLFTLILNISVAVSKIILGIVTGALSIIADGFHSLTDSVGNIVGLIVNSVASRPADDDHPYGHQRFETLGALFIGGLLMLTAWEMGQGILERLQEPELPDLTPLAFAVMLATLFVNIAVVTYQIRRGRELNSEILLADAKHTQVDVLVTLSVMGSMAIINFTGWAWVDIVAGLIVTGLILKTAWTILQDAGGILVDTAPYKSEQLHAIVADVPSIERIVRVRSRGTQGSAHIDIDVQVAKAMTTAQSNAIRDAIIEKLHNELTGISEVEVHFISFTDKGQNPALVVRSVADKLGIATHEVLIGHDADGCVLEMHVEVSSDLTLIEAHELADQLEGEAQSRLPYIDKVITHIEPSQSVQETVIPDDDNMAYAIESEAKQWLLHQFANRNWHNLRARRLRDGFALTLHVALEPEVTLVDAHKLAEDAEILLRQKIKQLERVTIHTEPY